MFIFIFDYYGAYFYELHLQAEHINLIKCLLSKYLDKISFNGTNCVNLFSTYINY